MACSAPGPYPEGGTRALLPSLYPLGSRVALPLSPLPQPLFLLAPGDRQVPSPGPRTSVHGGSRGDGFLVSSAPQYIRQHRPALLTMEEALEEVKKEL